MSAIADEILMVSCFMKDQDGTKCVKCPHCKDIVGLQSGSILGEQFKHPSCGGWFEVSSDARAVSWPK